MPESENIPEVWFDATCSWFDAAGLSPVSFTTMGARDFREGRRYPFAEMTLPWRRDDGSAGFSLLKIDAVPRASAPTERKDRAVFRSAALQIAESPSAPTVVSWCWTVEDPVCPHERLRWAQDTGLLDYGFADCAPSAAAAQVHAGLTPLFAASRDGMTVTTLPGVRDHVARVGGHVLDLLGDVYPVQVIQATHLARAVGTRTLGAWIAETPRRGALEPCGNNLWLWTISPACLDPVRKALAGAGLLTRYSQSGGLAARVPMR